jgi:hypothetical protein
MRCAVTIKIFAFLGFKCDNLKDICVCSRRDRTKIKKAAVLLYSEGFGSCQIFFKVGQRAEIPITSVS